MLNLARRLMKGTLAFRAVRVQAISGHSTGTQTDTGVSCTVDSAGNFLLCGHTSPSGTLPGWVAKFNSAQALQWQRKQSLTARFMSGGVAVDASDNVYVIGQGYVTSSPDLPMLLKYNTSGALQWQRQLTAADTSNLAGLVVNSSGDSFFLLAVQAATVYGIAAKYNTSGSLQWQRKLSGTYRVSYLNIAQASDGGVIAVGHMYDGGSAGSNSRGIVAKYDTSGAIQWQNKIHFGALGGWNSVAVDSVTGDIYIGGSYDEAGVVAGVVTKLNSAGVVQWTRRHPTTSTMVAAIVVDPETGSIYFAASLGRICCMDSSGNLVWERTIVGDTGAVVNFASSKAPKIYSGELLIAATANHTGASQGLDAVLIRLPLSGGVDTTCGYIVISIPSPSTFTSPTATSAAAGLTDAAGASTDAAGTATDAANTMTFTNYTN